MRAGSQYHYSLVTCTRQNTALHLSEPHKLQGRRHFPHPPCTIQLHSRTPSSCSACWASNTCKLYWPRNSINYRKCVCSKQRTRGFPLDFKYSLWTSSASVNNGVGCLGSGCLQRRWAGDEKQRIILEWPKCTPYRKFCIPLRYKLDWTNEAASQSKWVGCISCESWHLL